MSKTVYTRQLQDLLFCARCGKDHADLIFLPFTKPILCQNNRTVEFSHFAECPTTGEPVLMLAKESEVHNEG